MGSNGNHLPFCKMFTNVLSLLPSFQSTVSEKHKSDRVFPLFETFKRLPIVLSIQPAAPTVPSRNPFPSQGLGAHSPFRWGYFLCLISVTSPHREALPERPRQGWLPVTPKHPHLSFTAFIRCNDSSDISVVSVSTCLLGSILN